MVNVQAIFSFFAYKISTFERVTIVRKSRVEMKGVEMENELNENYCMEIDDMGKFEGKQMSDGFSRDFSQVSFSSGT